MSRYLPVTNGRLLEVHPAASQQAVVDFMFAALGVVRVLAREECLSSNAGDTSVKITESKPVIETCERNDSQLRCPPVKSTGA
jgi:hypothetical protein